MLLFSFVDFARLRSSVLCCAAFRVGAVLQYLSSEPNILARPIAPYTEPQCAHQHGSQGCATPDFETQHRHEQASKHFKRRPLSTQSKSRLGLTGGQGGPVLFPSNGSMGGRTLWLPGRLVCAGQHPGHNQHKLSENFPWLDGHCTVNIRVIHPAALPRPSRELDAMQRRRWLALQRSSQQPWIMAICRHQPTCPS